MVLEGPFRQALRCGSMEVPFTLTLSLRKTLKIAVAPDGQVAVEAPAGQALEEIMARVDRHRVWILRQLERVRQLHPLPVPRRYVSGETHLYLGRQYRLRIREGERDEVKLLRGRFEVSRRGPADPAGVKRLLGRWFDDHARAFLAARLVQSHSALALLGVPAPRRVSFRRMQKRWGSCSKSGSILLNTELAHAPVSCIDYVVTHELCHLKHPNHGPAFYSLLSLAMPDWRERKNRLERALL